MGKSEKALEKAAEKAAKKEKRTQGDAVAGQAGLSLTFFTQGFALVTTFGLCYVASTVEALRSEAEGRTNIWVRLFFIFLLQSSASTFFATLWLQVARRLNGEPWPPTSYEMTQKESAVHDASIPWPRPELLSLELQRHGSKKQPFSLNHVTGRQRCKDAFVRLGMSMGSTLACWWVCRTMEGRSLDALGLVLGPAFCSEVLWGLAVGVAIVAFTFAVELAMGWLVFLEAFQVFDASESFAACIFWDVFFHLNVALNEELPVRGWMLRSLSEFFVARFELLPATAFVLAMLFQSLFFVLMHLPSPGGRKPQSMANIFLGGIAGGVNVLLTGGRLGFALGWHFGWNISMGNVFGLSTSGIPISATFLAVAPLPGKESYHGGVFGPEGGVVSPVAYCLGMFLLFLIYGWPHSGLLV